MAEAHPGLTALVWNHVLWFGIMYLGKVNGIPVHIHWTFWLLLAFYVLPVLATSGTVAAISATFFMAGVFGSVLAHEFGHALAARKYGIRTVDITLLPIGGMARLEKLPKQPLHELWIALAGPAVNLAIIAVLLPLVLLGVNFGAGAPALESMGTNLVTQLMFANGVLFAFNLLPAFPMDGGRVLRSLLALRTTHLRATQIAARVGRWMALAFAVWAFTLGPISLLLIAGFVLVAGTTELMSVHMREMAQGRAPMDSVNSWWTGTASSAEPAPEPADQPRTWQDDPFGHTVAPENVFRQKRRRTDVPDEEVLDADDFRRIE